MVPVTHTAATLQVRLAGPDAARFATALGAVQVEGTADAVNVVYVALRPPDLDGLEDALAGWVDAAREAAAFGGDVVTVIADALLDSDDVAGCAYGHGLLAATRAFAMERERDGGIGNAVAADPGALQQAASTVAWLLRDRAVSGELLRAGARGHGRQRL